MSPRRKQSNDPIAAALAGIGSGLVGVGKLVWRVISGGKSKTKFNQAALFADWQTIESLADSSDAVHLSQAVQQADRFMDHVMQLAGARGMTFADRLRSLEPKFARNSYQELWNAHKLRNELAHQHGAKASVVAAKQALRQFRAAARELGAF